MSRFIAYMLLICPPVLLAQEPSQFRPGGPLAGHRGFDLGSQKTPLYPGAVEVRSSAAVDTKGRDGSLNVQIPPQSAK